MPALAYSVDGSPSKKGKLYAALPACRSMKKTTTVKECTGIDIYSGAVPAKNSNANSVVRMHGKGLKKDGSLKVSQLENMPDITMKINNGCNGPELYALLKSRGLTVDAGGVTIHGENSSIELDINAVKKGKYILATRKKGKELDKADGPIELAGDASVKNVRKISVHVRPGQWTHDAGVYRRYEENKIVITGSAINKRIYTLKQLETLKGKYRVRDSFASSAGHSGYQGIVLRKLIIDNAREGVKKPSSITVFGRDGYRKSIPVDAVYNGVRSRYQAGESREVILAYSIDGVPLVKGRDSAGYTGSNGFGPVRLIIENQASSWIKNVVKIVVKK